MHRQLSLMLHVRPSNAAASLYSSVLDLRCSFRRVLQRRRPSCFWLKLACREDELLQLLLVLAATSALPAGDPNKLTKPSTSCNERRLIENRVRDRRCLIKYPAMKTYGEWRCSSMPRPLYPRGKSPRCTLDRRLIGPQSRSGRGGLLLLPEIESRSSSP
jgi:hypothetical protein